MNALQLKTQSCEKGHSAEWVLLYADANSVVLLLESNLDEFIWVYLQRNDNIWVLNLSLIKPNDNNAHIHPVS